MVIVEVGTEIPVDVLEVVRGIDVDSMVGGKFLFVARIYDCSHL